MHPQIQTIKEKKLIGIHVRMSLADNRTGWLWSRFAPSIKDIPNRVSQDKISMQLYDADYHRNFSPERTFEKWAAVEVNSFDEIPPGMKAFVLPRGLYAAFDYRGSSADPAIFRYIFGEWLPQSPYHIDDRPHFEVLGEKYRNNDPDSEEEIWIPIVEKG